MQVEDIDESEFEDKWPYSLDKRVEEEPVQDYKPQPLEQDPNTIESQR